MKLFILMAAILLVLAKPVSAQLTEASAVAGANTAIRAVAMDSLFGDVRILPIPASNEIVLFVNGPNANNFSQGDAIIYNSGGRPFAKAHFTTGTNNIFVSNLASGMYFLRLIQKNGQTTVKQFVVTR